jgi:Rieske Fe-S protein
VIGYTNQATNSAKTFTNPKDGNSSMLIHQPNGNFVACERQCTHQGVNVNYDAGSQKLVCPAHGAVFDPANGFNLTQGPGNGPLAGVSIRVNTDGTITTG